MTKSPNPRIPPYEPQTYDGMTTWFQKMADRKLIFHPDDAPESMQWIATGEPMFTEEESAELREIMGSMFNRFGDRVYESIYPIFMKAAGLPTGDE